MLPVELVKLIFSYLSLKALQKLHNGGYRMFLTINVDFNDDYSDNKVLTPFESYCNQAMLQGQVGFNGQFYLPPYICLLYSARIGDVELINYYLIRYLDGNKRWAQDVYSVTSMLTPILPQLLLTISKDSVRPMLINYFNKFYHNLLKHSNYHNKTVKHNNYSALQFVQPDWLQPGALRL